jgi:hypothetical protein
VSVREVKGQPGPWRWQCDEPNDRWHFRVDDCGWADSRDEALALLAAHMDKEHTKERSGRWSVESPDPGEWWALGPGRTFRHTPFTTWRGAFDYADREARR